MFVSQHEPPPIPAQFRHALLPRTWNGILRIFPRPPKLKSWEHGCRNATSLSR